jgi:hypothetical protein
MRYILTLLLVLMMCQTGSDRYILAAWRYAVTGRYRCNE